MASHVKLRSCSLLRRWSIDISALKKTPGKVNWQTPGSFAFKYNGVSHARWIVFYQCTGTRCESHSWYRKLFDWGKKKDENGAALPKEKASETIRKGSVWPPHGMSQFLKCVLFEQDYHALFVLAIYIACLSDTLFVSKFHYIKVKVFIYCIYLRWCVQGRSCLCLCLYSDQASMSAFFRKETPKKSLPFFILRCLPGSKNGGYPPGIRCRSLVNSDARKKAGWKHHGTWTVLKVLILWPYMLYNYIYIISNEI